MEKRSAKHPLTLAGSTLQAEDERDPASLKQLRDAVLARAHAERSIRDAVTAARADGQSWAAIGSLLGTSSEAAGQRYGHPQTA